LLTRKLRAFEVAISQGLAKAGGYQYGFKSGALMWLPPTVWPSWAWMCNCLSNNSLNLGSANPTAPCGQTGDRTMTSSAPTHRPLIELNGEAVDIQRLESIAPACGCTIEPGPDAKLGWLGSAKSQGAKTPEEAEEEATKKLVLLNGLARLETPEHRNVGVGDAFFQNGRIHYYQTEPDGTTPRKRKEPAGSVIHRYESPLTGGRFVPPIDPADSQRRAHIATDPKLAEIAEVFGEEITWQRLRVAFEKINALVGKGDNALVKNGYATQEELTRFKANVEDPRHSGVDAVHGVHKGPLKGTKMTEGEGHDFVVGLLHKYLEKHPSE
jgi:hypothetical protein